MRFNQTIYTLKRNPEIKVRGGIINKYIRITENEGSCMSNIKEDVQNNHPLGLFRF